MIWIYFAAAIFGGGFIIPALIGSLDFETDMDVDFDTDVDLGGGEFEVDADLDTGGVELESEVGSGAASGAAAVAHAAGGIGDWVASLLTFRSLIFVSAFFGASGMVFTWLDYPALLTLVAAIALGLFAGLVNARLMAYLTRTGTSGRVTEHHLRGSIARVVLPVGDDRRGRVEVDMAGQPLFMSAQPYRRGTEDLSPGEAVVVVEVKGGTAYVMSAPELRGGK